jgi:hypothetical protein
VSATHLSRRSWPSGRLPSPSPRFKKIARRGQPDASADDLLVELNTAHVQLRELFTHGLDDAVFALARDVMELASETTDLLNQDQEPSGN